MSAGLPKFVTVNLADLEKSFEAGATVDLAAVQDKKLLNISGRDSKLALKVLGEGELSKPLTIKAAKFSSSASEKISAAGATAEELPQRAKWTRRAHEKVRAGRPVLPVLRCTALYCLLDWTAPSALPVNRIPLHVVPLPKCCCIALG
jgi:large subunit ribosomal protein L15